MMAGWSNALVKKLASGGMGYLEATGLATDLTGQEFELRLGRFLRNAAAFKESSPLVGPSVQFQSWQFPINEQALTDWHRSSCFHVDRITSLIHETLYEEFG